VRVAVAVVALLSQVFASCTAAEQISHDAVAVGVSVSLKDGGNVELSIYNLEDFAVCAPIYNWPGSVESDIFVVFGKDGKRWNYSGGEYDTIGDVPQTKIAPRSSIEWSGPIQIIYKPPVGASDKVGKVYYRSYFERC